MIDWVLVFLILNPKGPTISTIPDFRTQEACEKASRTLQASELGQHDFTVGRLETTCVQRDRTED